MGEKRTWDESRSPQWRYLLSKDSKEKRDREKREERMEQAESTLKRGISKRKRKAAETQKEKNEEKRKTKAGKEILYSASPGGEKNRYHNTEFVSRKRQETHERIFNTNTTFDNDETQ